MARKVTITAANAVGDDVRLTMDDGTTAIVPLRAARAFGVEIAPEPPIELHLVIPARRARCLLDRLSSLMMLSGASPSARDLVRSELRAPLQDALERRRRGED